MTRFADCYVFGPEAALAEMRRQVAEPEREHDHETERETNAPETESHDARDDLAAREKALRRPWGRKRQ